MQKSLQKFLTGKIDNVKLDRWSLELPGRNITVEQIPGTNQAAVFLSRLTSLTRKGNDNPLNNTDFFKEPILELTQTSISSDFSKPEETDTICRVCELHLTDMTAQEKPDKHCITRENLIKNKESIFLDRDKYVKEEALHHINQENNKEYKAVVVPKALLPTVLKKCMIDVDTLA